MARYIVDIDALKDCIQLLPKRYDSNNSTTVRLDDVIKMIDSFPRDFPINYTGQVISTSPAIVPDTLKGWEVICDSN